MCCGKTPQDALAVAYVGNRVEGRGGMVGNRRSRLESGELAMGLQTQLGAPAVDGGGRCHTLTLTHTHSLQIKCTHRTSVNPPSSRLPAGPDADGERIRRRGDWPTAVDDGAGSTGE